MIIVGAGSALWYASLQLRKPIIISRRIHRQFATAPALCVRKFRRPPCSKARVVQSLEAREDIVESSKTWLADAFQSHQSLIPVNTAPLIISKIVRSERHGIPQAATQDPDQIIGSGLYGDESEDSECYGVMVKKTVYPEKLKAQLVDLVDIYGDAKPPDLTSPDVSPFKRHPLPIASFPHVHNPGAMRVRPTAAEKAIIGRLCRLLDNPDTSWHVLYKQYCKLACPRCPKLWSSLRQRLLYRLATHDPDSRAHLDGQLRNAYFSIINEMVDHDIRLTSNQCNSAISLTLRAQAVVREQDLVDVMQIWHRVRGFCEQSDNTRIMTTLFLAASKCAKFGLAARLWFSLSRQGQSVDRIARICQIYSAGLSGAYSSILAAWTAFVHEEHMIDIDVIEITISALVKAGQVSAAHEVIRRLWSFSQHDVLVRNDTSWRYRRRLRRHLAQTSSAPLSDKVDVQCALQSTLTPTQGCYTPLLYHYAVTLADFDRACALVSEMAAREIPVSYVVCNIIFAAFHKNALIHPSTFSPQALHSWWAFFKKMVENDANYADKIDGRLLLHLVGAFVRLNMRHYAFEARRLLTRKWSPSASINIAVSQILTHSNPSSD